MKELNKILDRKETTKNLMSLSRECSKLSSLGLITTDFTKRKEGIKSTPLGTQYSIHNQFERPQLKLVWQRKEENIQTNDEKRRGIK